MMPIYLIAYEKLINQEEDRVLIVRCCPTCKNKIESIENKRSEAKKLIKALTCPPH